MWLVLSVCFVTVTAILGITEILRRFWLFIMRPKGTLPAIMVISLKEDVAVQQLRYALEFLSWEKKGDFSLTFEYLCLQYGENVLYYCIGMTHL